MYSVLVSSWLGRRGSFYCTRWLARQRRWTSTNSGDGGAASKWRLAHGDGHGNGHEASGINHKTSHVKTLSNIKTANPTLFRTSNDDHLEAPGDSIESVPAKVPSHIDYLGWDDRTLNAFDPYGGIVHNQDVGTVMPLFRVPSYSGTRDLSYSDAFDKPRSNSQALWTEISLKADDLLQQGDIPLQFRASGGLRQLVMRWCERLAADPSAARSSLQAQIQNEELRRDVFDGDAIALLACSHYRQEDVITWSWILMAKTTTELVGRYLQMLEEMRRTNNAALAHFVVLQILRAKFIPPEGFRAIVRGLSGKWKESDDTLLERDARKFAQDAQETDDEALPTADAYTAREWNQSASVLLVVRLLRHARLTAPDTFDDIITIALNRLFGRLHKQDMRLSNICNRLLKLLALPITMFPGRHVYHQKNAQIRLLREMLTSDPEIPLNREGYRSLISIQLAQPKTEEEIAWARTKSLSWPPWREDKLGIDQLLTYPGQQTRAYKLLRRMNEAGYAHASWEKAAKIYSGWDTDDSPTIQTRKYVPVLLHDDVAAPIKATDPLIWAARIQATRSVREAWAAFLAYRNQIKKDAEQADILPYESMFDKLLAPIQPAHVNPNSVPGDAWDTWPDSPNPQDVIYVPEEPPSVDGLYCRMVQDNLRASGRLLADLVRYAPSLDLAVKYIEEGLVPNATRRALLRNHLLDEHSSFEPGVAARPRLIAAFIEQLMAHPAGSSNVFLTTSQAIGDNGVKPALLGMSLVRIFGSNHPIIYKRALKGLLRRIKQHVVTQEQRGRTFYHETWIQLREILVLMRRRLVFEEGRTFILMSELYMQLLNRGPWPLWKKRTINPLNWSKGMFTRWVYGTSEDLRWLTRKYVHKRAAVTAPSAYELRVLIEIMGIFRDTQGILELIVWISEHASWLQKAHSDMRLKPGDMESVHIAARIFVEKLLENTVVPDIEDQLQAYTSAKIKIASREDCLTYIYHREGWRYRHERYQRLREMSNREWYTAQQDSDLD